MSIFITFIHLHESMKYVLLKTLNFCLLIWGMLSQQNFVKKNIVTFCQSQNCAEFRITFRGSDIMCNPFFKYFFNIGLIVKRFLVL